MVPVVAALLSQSQPKLNAMRKVSQKSPFPYSSAPETYQTVCNDNFPDRDGDIDIITCEHKMPWPGKNEKVKDDEELQIWENDGKGQFTKHTVNNGKESHLGAQVCDLDNDEDLDIISIAWRNYQYLHFWRNDSNR